MITKEKRSIYNRRWYQEHGKEYYYKNRKKKLFYNKVKQTEYRRREGKLPRELLRGKMHPNWTGLRPLQTMIRNIVEFKQWRKMVFQRDDYTCQECFKKGGNLEPHHKKLFFIIFTEFIRQYSQFSPFDDKEILLRLATTYDPFWDINNGKTLCRDCHNIERKKDKKIISMYQKS